MTCRDSSTGNSTWYWVDTGFACGAIVVESGKIVDAAPIFRKHSLGRNWGEWKRQRSDWRYEELPQGLALPRVEV